MVRNVQLDVAIRVVKGLLANTERFMSAVELQSVMQQIAKLTTEERLRLRQFIDALPQVAPQDELDSRLHEAGLISRPHRPAPLHHNRFEPIRVTGKPVSHTIIEERR